MGKIIIEQERKNKSTLKEQKQDNSSNRQHISSNTQLEMNQRWCQPNHLEIFYQTMLCSKGGPLHYLILLFHLQPRQWKWVQIKA